MAEIKVVAVFLDWPIPTIARISFTRWGDGWDPEVKVYAPIVVDPGDDEPVTGPNGRSGGPVLASS